MRWFIRHRGLVEFRKLRKVLVYGIREIGIDDIREIFVLLFRMLLVRVYRTNFRVPFDVSIHGNGLRDGG